MKKREELPTYVAKELKRCAKDLLSRGYTGSLLEKYRDLEIKEQEK